MTTTVEDLASECGGEVRGDPTLVIHDAQALDKAGPRHITFVADQQNVRGLQECSAGAVILSRQLQADLGEIRLPPALILVDDAQVAFIQVLQRLRPERPRPDFGVSPDAFVAPSASVGPNTNIHAGAHVGEDVVIGENCDIFPGAYVGSGCRLGNNVTLYPNVVLYPDVVIGDRVIIHASAVLGADGFGYRFEGGRYVKIPQRGTVHVEDDVELGACCTIDRGMIGPTIIGEGTKLDNLTMIAHNCELGKHNAFVSQVGLAGSVTTGDYVRCAGQVGIADHVHLGTGCTLAAKAGVHKDIPPGEVYLGTPARPKADQIRIALAATKLPEMRKQLRKLESQVAALTERLQELTADSADK